MRVTFVAHHLPHPQGTSAGRQLWAVVEALRAAGDDATVRWWGPPRPGLEAPVWCDAQPAPSPERSLRRLPETVMRPRRHLAHVGWDAGGAVVIADNRDSAPALTAVQGSPARGVVIHHSVRIDAAATRRRRPSTVQEWRAERYAVAATGRPAALSQRVGRAVGARRVLMPTVPAPAGLLAPVDDPVALLFADWSWPPNQKALVALLADWSEVSRQVSGARLVVAGRGSARVQPGNGIEVVGEVAHPADLMATAAVLAFPCPPSSGPKLKVLDAVLHGLPVVTTPAGVEGLSCGGVRVAEDHSFSAALIDSLRDPAGRCESARQALAAASRHLPQAAAGSWRDYAATAT
jgi:hypothetical protein